MEVTHADLVHVLKEEEQHDIHGFKMLYGHRLGFLPTRRSGYVFYLWDCAEIIKMDRSKRLGGLLRWFLSSCISISAGIRLLSPTTRAVD